MNTYFPEPSSVLASMFFHFLENDFVIRCICYIYTMVACYAYNDKHMLIIPLVPCKYHQSIWYIDTMVAWYAYKNKHDVGYTEIPW
jgi:hypothetical protein